MHCLMVLVIILLFFIGASLMKQSCEVLAFDLNTKGPSFAFS